MKKILASAILVFYMSQCFAQTGKSGRLTPEEFVIMPWSWPPGDSSTFKDVYDCGFNLAGFVKAEDLKSASKSGLKAIVYDNSADVRSTVSANGESLSEGEITKRVNEIARKTANDKAVFSYLLMDEPGTEYFPALKAWKDAFAKAIPNSLTYINLYPNYANNETQLKAKSYEDYLEKYVSMVKPKYISYDNYSLMKDGSLRAGYFENLEAVRNVTLKNNIPFWNIVLSNAHFDYAEPSYAGLCFQLYTTLAYGGKGICYFTYYAPQTGNYRLAPIDQFGHKTATWYLLQNVNLQMHAIGKAYMKLKSVNVFHFSDSKETKGNLKPSRFLSSLKGDSLLVGEFEDSSKAPYIIVVNKSLVKSQLFDVTFTKPGTIYQINNYTGEAEPWGGESNWLAPGQGRIMFVKKEEKGTGK